MSRRVSPGDLPGYVNEDQAPELQAVNSRTESWYPGAVPQGVLSPLWPRPPHDGNHCVGLASCALVLARGVLLAVVKTSPPAHGWLLRQRSKPSPVARSSRDNYVRADERLRANFRILRRGQLRIEEGRCLDLYRIFNGVFVASPVPLQRGWPAPQDRQRGFRLRRCPSPAFLPRCRALTGEDNGHREPDGPQ